MTTYSGYDGYFMSGPAGSASAVGEMNHWTLTVTSAMQDVTVFGSKWAKFKPGIVSYTGTVDGFFDCADTGGQDELEDSIIDGSQIEAYYYATGSKYYYGEGYTSNMTVDVPVDGIITTSFDVQGTSTLNTSCN